MRSWLRPNLRSLREERPGRRLDGAARRASYDRMGRRITGMRRSAIRVLFTVLSIGAAVCAVTAQTARQGEAGERTGFASPMVLESVFAPAMPSHAKDEPWFSIDEYHDLGKYSCDGVFIRKAQIGPIKCEEGDESSKQATLVLARETLRSDPVTRMRLTMRTEDD